MKEESISVFDGMSGVGFVGLCSGGRRMGGVILSVAVVLQADGVRDCSLEAVEGKPEVATTLDKFTTNRGCTESALRVDTWGHQ